MIVRNSEVMDFLRCRLRWNYRWNRQLEPQKKSTKLVLGTLFHKFLESYYHPTAWTEARFYTAIEPKLNFAITEMKRMYNTEVATKIEEGTYDPVEASEMWNLVEGLAKWYHEYWSERQIDKWEIVATEQTYYINMRTLEWTIDRSKAEEWADDIVYEATLDLVLRIDGKLYIADHKTASQIDTFVKKIEMDRQISRYIFAANVIFKEEIHGLVYNIIKKEVPHAPRETKKGLSVAKDQRTTYNLYFKALDEKGLIQWSDDTHWTTEDGYMEVLQLLKNRELPNAQGNDFLRRVLVKRNKAELNNAMNEFMQTATAIRNMRNFLVKHEGKALGYNNPIYRNITNDCSWDCGYKACCIAGMDGSDVEYLEESLLEPIKTYKESADE